MHDDSVLVHVYCNNTTRHQLLIFKIHIVSLLFYMSFLPKILTSTFTEGQHSFDMPSRGHVDSYAQYSVMPKYTRPATAPCTRQMPPAELELEPEPEPSQSSNTFSDTSPERDTDTRPRGKPSIKRKVLR